MNACAAASRLAAHTAATYAQIVRAVEHGLRQTTHTFNAMTGLGHREPGAVGAAMTIDHLYTELIADNIHVHPATMKNLVKVKGPERVILVSDAIRGAGMPDGDYKVGARTLTVRDGTARLPDGTLAGSVLTMDRALRNIMAATGLPLQNLADDQLECRQIDRGGADQRQFGNGQRRRSSCSMPI